MNRNQAIGYLEISMRTIVGRRKARRVAEAIVNGLAMTTVTHMCWNCGHPIQIGWKGYER